MSTFIDALAGYVPSLVARQVAADPTPLAQAKEDRFDTAVLFADISGFTPLTEDLVNSGPAGVENLSRILNDYFGQLVDTVTAYGGDIVKFAGDSLLALWPSTDLGQATMQAAQAALALQVQMMGFRAGEKRQRLLLKISISAGEVNSGHLGGRNGRWEFIINGIPLSEVSIAEKFAQPGQVVVAPSAWQQIMDRCLGYKYESGYVQLQTIHSPVTLQPRQTPMLPESAKDALYAYLPGAIKARLNARQTDWLADLRRVSVIFMTLPGLNPDTTLDRAQAIMETLQATLYRFEGSVNKISVDDKGLTLLAALGLPPLAHEDDAVLAVQAARALYTALTELGFPCAAGVTTGRAFCGTIGNSTRREYTMIGDVVNMAARLMQNAVAHTPPGDVPILCDEVTFEEAKSRLHFATLEPIPIKGKQGLVPVYRPLGEKRPAIHSEEATTIVGREKERMVLNEALQQLMQGKSQTIVIEGEAGIGKSQLVNNLQRQAEAMRVGAFVGSGTTIERAASYHAWRNVFSQMFDIGILVDPQAQQRHLHNLLEDEPEILERISLLNPILPFNLPDNELTAQMTGQTRADNTRDLLIRLLQDSVNRSPKLIILEDAHLLDSVSWDLVLAVSRRVRPCLLVLALRPIPEPRPEVYEQLVTADNAHHLTLDTLSAEETLLLIQNRLGVAALPGPVADLILEKGGGNPFFSEELAFTLRDTGYVTIINGACQVSPQVDFEALSLPDTVQGIVMSRIDRLLPGEQLTLKVASVIGRFFAYNTLRDVYPIGEDKPRLPQYLQQLEQRALTTMDSPEPELSYTFNHIITQEVAYNLLLYEQRRQLHDAVAVWYEKTYGLQTNGREQDEAPQPSSLVLSLLVHHHHHAGNVARERHYATLAGHQAVLQFANAEAVHYLSRALELTKVDDYQARYELLLARESVYNLQGLREAQEQDLTALEAVAYELGEERQQAAVYVRWANFAAATSNYPTAIVAAQEAIQLAEQCGDREIEAAGYLQWGRALTNQGTYIHAQPHLEKALELAQKIGAHQLKADSLRDLGLVARGQGDSAKAREYHRQALSIRREIGDRRGEGQSLNSLGSASRLQGEFTKAVTYHEEALQILREIGDRHGEGTTLDDLAGAWANQGNYETARQFAEQSLRIKREISDRNGEGDTLNTLGNIAGNQGELALALAYHEDALRIKREIGDLRGLGQVLNSLGLLALGQGRFEEAEQYFAEVLPIQQEIGNRMGEAWVYHSLGNLAAVYGQFGRALDYVMEALKIHRELHFRKGQAITLNLLGHVCLATADFDAAKGHLLAGLRLARQIGYRKGEALLLAGLGLLHHMMGDEVMAYDYSQQALSLTQALQHPSSQGFALTNLGYALVGLGRMNEAITVLQQAVQLRQKTGEAHLLLDSWGGLAYALWRQKSLRKAQQYVDEILRAGSPYLRGSFQPLRILMTCYRVLVANGDERALVVLQRAHELWQQQAASIVDEERRRFFWEGVPLHREIGEEVKRHA
ncbi:MAG: tetratricopeptide repeat protein [Ardenticatenaceae bacterium]|nr:tetratricopeptide repeat protein [Ardenticatenaceae bacterium]